MDLKNRVAIVTGAASGEGPHEPVIGHITADHRMDGNYLKGHDGIASTSSSPPSASTSTSS
jgi:hypothetical protein